ncbi:tyrosine-type recombinase/integrase [Peribacillus frigoritolerans]|nr:tyrosine-type recombinase/integrase [Peribacillus frigoritolerans]
MRNVKNTQRKRLGEQYQDQDLVICTEFGTLQDPRNVLRVMKRISKAANVTSIRFHDIRHTHASILISEGVDIVKVAARLGHSDPTITLKNYAHMMPNQDDEVADIFHNALQKLS